MKQLATASLLILAGAAFAAEHPNIQRFPGFSLESSEVNDYNEVELVTGWDEDSGEEKTTAVAGRYWKNTYHLDEGARAPSPVELVKNFENALKKLDATTLLRRSTRGDGRLTVKMPLGKGQRWVHLHVFNSGEGYELTVLEEAGMKQKLEFTATQMLEALDRDGFISLYGIEFDTGKDILRPESELLLAEIVTLLRSNGELKLSVEGHSDAMGNAQFNLALSKKRAERVKQFLVGKGISAARLSTAGLGQTRPLADNRTAEGRAKNRRVELVKK